MTRTRNSAPHGAMPLAVAMVMVAMLAATGPSRAFAQTSTRVDSSLTVTPPAAAKAAPPRATERVRTLDAISIEGEVAVPQVLFITARDVRRFRDGLGKKFQLSAIEAGRAAVLPSRLRVTVPRSHKEE